MECNGSAAPHQTCTSAFRAVVSKVHTLEEGDLLLTGTSQGVDRVTAGDTIDIGIHELNSSRLTLWNVFNICKSSSK